MAKQNSPLAGDTISGFGWSGIALLGVQVGQFIILAVLARLLEPSDFGTIAIILVVTDFLAIFNGELGFAEALIQKTEVSPLYFSSVFWMNLAIGICMGLSLYFAASPIGNFYQDQTISNILKSLAIYFPIYAFRTVPISILRREMKFRAIAISELLAILISGIIGISFALQGAGVWSLVWRYVAYMAVMVVIMLWMSRWRPTLQFSFIAIRELLAFSANMIGFYFWDYWTRRADNFLIGKFLGTTPLGFYTRAYTTAMLPYQVSLVTRRVMLPALSRIQNDPVLIKATYLRALEFVIMFTAPLLFGLFVVAEDFILVIYGPKWLPMAPTMRLLCIVALFLVLGSTVDSIYQSQGRTDLLFRWGLAAGLAAIVSFTLGIYIGSIAAVAGCYAIALVIIIYWNFKIPGQLIGMKPFEVIRHILPYMVAGLAMSLTIWLITVPLAAFSAWQLLFIQVMVGCCAYILFLHLLNATAYLEAKDIGFSLLAKRRE